MKIYFDHEKLDVYREAVEPAYSVELEHEHDYVREHE